MIETVKRKIPFDDFSVPFACDISQNLKKKSEEVKNFEESKNVKEPESAEEPVKENTKIEKNEQIEVAIGENGEISQSSISDPVHNDIVSCGQVVNVVKVDEICQTDREQDVDENGPKFRCVSQQTCPILSGLGSDGFKLVNEKEIIKTGW